MVYYERILRVTAKMSRSNFKTCYILDQNSLGHVSFIIIGTYTLALLALNRKQYFTNENLLQNL